MLCRKCKKEILESSTYCSWCGAAQALLARKPKARGNGQGTVYQLPNGKWRAEIRVYSGGIRRRATKSGFARKKDALDYLPQLLPKQRQKVISFCELFDRWSAKKFETISKSKAIAYKIAYKRCGPLYHIKDWTQVRLADMQEIVDDAGTFYPQRDIKQLLNAMGEYAIKYEFATENLAPYIELVQYKTPEREVFTDEEIDRLWKRWCCLLDERYRCEDYWCGERAVGITTTPKETHEAFFLASLACDKLEELSKSEQPFSLRVDFWGPHQPFFPTQEFADLYRPEDIELYPSFSSTLEDKPDVLKAEASLPLGDGKQVGIPNPLPWSEWQKLLARCYAHTTMVDAAGGQILDKIKELKLEDNTLIIWSSDHGDAIACHGGHIDKNSHMAEEVMRIPLAINWKGNIAPGGRCDAYAFTCDIPVTLMDAAGVHFPERTDGRTLLDLLIPERSVAPWRDSLMCESYGHGYGASKIGRMAVKGHMKYVCTEGDLDELYDLEQDPYQLKNLSNLPAYANVKKDMQALLRQKQAESCDPVPLVQLLPRLT